MDQQAREGIMPSRQIYLWTACSMRPVLKMIGPLWCFFSTGHVCTFSTFSGFAEIPLANKIWPRKRTLVSKNWHFLGLIFRLNCFSLSNTSSIRSNISFIVGAKMQMSLRYSNRVTNCWFPQALFHQATEARACIWESKRHMGKLVQAHWTGSKCSLLDVTFLHR